MKLNKQESKKLQEKYLLALCVLQVIKVNMGVTKIQRKKPQKTNIERNRNT